MIPKKIHYCWFGRNPKPKLAQKCMQSWHKYCNDYEIVEWNEDSFDLEAAPLYVKQAYEAKKWAFVTDYVRLYALYYHGGIYMDTDVEVTKPFNRFLKLKGFSGFEDEISVPTGIMAAEAGHPLIKEWLDEYDDKLFLLPDGSMNMETNVLAITHSMVRHGLKLDNTLQTVADYTFYPKDYFCPKSAADGLIYRTKNTHTIHHFAGSWMPADMKKKFRNEQIFQLIIYVPKRILKLILGKERFLKFKRLFGRGL